MKFNYLVKSSYAIMGSSKVLDSRKSTTIWIIMKLILFFTLAFTLQVSANVFAQRISLSVNNQPLKQVLKELRKQSRYSFMYSDTDLQSIKTVSLKVRDKELLDVLPLLFENLPLTYTVNGKIISIRKKKETEPKRNIEITQYEDPQTKDWIIDGRVIDAETNEPLEGVTIQLTQRGISTQSDKKGNFRLIISNRKKGSR